MKASAKAPPAISKTESEKLQAIQVDPVAAALKDVAAATARQVDIPEIDDRFRPLNGAPSATILPLMIAPLTATPHFMAMVQRSLTAAFWGFSPMRFAPPAALSVMRACTPPVLSAGIPRHSDFAAAAQIGAQAADSALVVAARPNPSRESAKLNAPQTAPRA